jgi:hypothetical protein
MPILYEGHAYTPTGVLDDQVRAMTPLPHVQRSRRKDKRRIRLYRKNLVKKLYEDGILKK